MERGLMVLAFILALMASACLLDPESQPEPKAARVDSIPDTTTHPVLYPDYPPPGAP